MAQMQRPLALVTGGSSGIGLELARLCVTEGGEVVIAADERVEEALAELSGNGAIVSGVETDLSTTQGVDKALEALRAKGRPADYLFANAGRGLGKGFLDQDFNEIMSVIDTNVVGTLYLIHEVGRDMRSAGAGRILITGSIAGILPGSFQAVYNGSKAFIDNFGYALRNELKDSGVSVTLLMPGATDTDFFHRADLDDTSVGQGKKDDPADVAKTGFHAMMRGEASVVHGVMNKVQAAMANILPKTASAESHRKMAQPGSGTT